MGTNGEETEKKSVFLDFASIRTHSNEKDFFEISIQSKMGFYFGKLAFK